MIFTHIRISYWTRKRKREKEQEEKYIIILYFENKVGAYRVCISKLFY